VLKDLILGKKKGEMWRRKSWDEILGFKTGGRGQVNEIIFAK